MNQAEAHRQKTGHGYSLEVVTGKWKCETCKANGKIKVTK